MPDSKPADNDDKRKALRKRLLILAIVLLVAAAVLGALANFLTEYWWFKHLGFSDVFITVLLSQLGTGIAYGAVAFVVLIVHILLIKRYSKPRKDWTIPTAEGDIDIAAIVKKVSTPVVAAGAFVAAAAMGVWAAFHWEDILKLLNQTQFGNPEPILGKDPGFYLFELPALQFSQEWLVYLTGFCAFFSAVVYFFRGAITVEGKLPKMSKEVRAHLLGAVAVVLLVIAWGFRLEMFETLFSKRGVAYGATYTDVVANLISYRVLIAASVVCAVWLVITSRNMPDDLKKSAKLPGYALGGLVVLYLIGVFVAPTLVQRLIVNPNELTKEKPYLVHAIAGTRRAYNLDKIDSKEFPANENLNVKTIERNKPTISNIKIWDPRPLKDAYRQLQVIRLYYDFPNIGIDRYRVGDNYWQVMLSAREMMHKQLPTQSQTWVNRHLQYTHGYGAVLSPVNRTVGEGQPDLWVKDIPPVAKHPALAVTQPAIYYGLQTTDYALVKTQTQEFDYPKGKENKFTTYSGKGGVDIGGFFARLLFAIRFADYNLLFTSQLTEKSRVLFNRTIQQRVHDVAPFLMLDQEPYMVIANGRLKWIQDAYTISYRYPYSQPTSLGRRLKINYIRNSVKIVIDAYDGDMSFYVWDAKDPMIRTYRKIFPSLFKDAKTMPQSLRAHVRYPKDLFTLQARMYESFHMTDPRVFYNQEDKWSISKELGHKTKGETKAGPNQPGVSAKRVTDASPMQPYYMIMRLPDAAKEEFLLMVPYTPSNKDNMVAWITASCDGDKYGKLLVYTFPKQKLVYGPMQVEARIDQNDYISQWITLRNQQGSKVFRGDLLVIPIEDSILYVEPIYLEATQAQLPELKKVIVS
ncbi:MAG: UPF0182 family protein, partial [Myxococcales bacterium]|nr:UPF0182 family protein [Myxococcales bacterium]